MQGFKEKKSFSSPVFYRILMIVATVEAALLAVLKKVQNVSYRILVEVATTGVALQVLYALEAIL